MRFRTARTAGGLLSIAIGWVAGAGVEAKLAGSNWIGRLEYLHYDFGCGRAGQQPVRDLSEFSFLHRASRAGRATTSSARDCPTNSARSPPRAPFPTPRRRRSRPRCRHGRDFISAFTAAMVGERTSTAIPGGLRRSPALPGQASRAPSIGGHAGYNWQFDRAVAGFELDFSGTDIKGNSPTSFAGAESASSSTNIAYLGSLRARLGWSATDNWLLYGTAGLGWERLDRNLLIVSPASGRHAKFRQRCRLQPVRLGRRRRRGSETARQQLDRSRRISALRLRHHPAFRPDQYQHCRAVVCRQPSSRHRCVPAFPTSSAIRPA